MEAINAATIQAAALPGMKDKPGSITPGKLAGIVTVHGDGLVFKNTTANLAE